MRKEKRIEPVPALYAILILSAASAEVRKRKTISNATNIFSLLMTSQFEI